MLSHQEIIVIKFDSCISKALKNELKYRKRSIKNEAKRIVNFSEMTLEDMNKLYTIDEYAVEMFCEKITTSLFDVTIHDELLYKALLSLKEKNREILLLKYWGDLTDAEIGQALSMSQQVVNYNRNRALKLLKNILKEMKSSD